MLGFIRKFFQSDATGTTNPNDVCTLVVGSKGVGKTYSRVRWFAQVFLPNYPKRRLITNFELHIPELAAYVEAYTGGKVKAEDVADRITILPREITNPWKRGDGSGPWDLQTKHGIKTAGNHIDIDEIHNFCSSVHKNDHKQKWMDWMGELRHARTTTTFVTQAEEKLAPMIRRECSIVWDLLDKGRMRDPFFGFLLGDAWQISAKLNGAYIPAVQERESSDWSKKNKEKPRIIEWSRTPDIFPLYNSYSKPIHDLSEGQRVIAFCPARDVEACLHAGALAAGAESLAAQVEQGFKDFDLVFCHPSCVDVMAPVSDLLGDKGATLENERIAEDLPKAIKKVVNDDSAPPMEWELRSWPSLLFWFIRRNGWGFIRKVGPVVLLVAFLSFGGIKWIMTDGVKYVSGAASSKADAPSLPKNGTPGLDPATGAPLAGPGAKPGAKGVPVAGSSPDPEKQRLMDSLAQEKAATASALAAQEAERKRAEALRETLARQSALVAVSPSFIILQGGYTYELNEKIDTGIFNGRTLKKIDTVRRCAVLDDGRILRLGQSPTGGSVEAGSEKRPVEAQDLRPAPGPSRAILGRVGQAPGPVRPVSPGDADIKPGAVAR